MKFVKTKKDKTMPTNAGISQDEYYEIIAELTHEWSDTGIIYVIINDVNEVRGISSTFFE